MSNLYFSGREIVQRGTIDAAKHKLSVQDMQSLGFQGLETMDGALNGTALTGGTFSRDFLSHQMAGVIKQATSKHVLDEITGVVTAGNWYDKDIVWDVESLTGKPELYGDTSNIPLASFSLDEERRGIVVMELGFSIGVKEEARLGARGVAAAERKRAAVQRALEESREAIGFYGINSTSTRVFGLLNEPNLPAYEDAAALFSTGTFASVTKEIADAMGRLFDQSGERIEEDTEMTILLPSTVRGAMGYSNVGGKGETVREWISANYPNTRVVFTGNFNAANGADNVMYVFADQVDVGDGAMSATILQIVPAQYVFIGSEEGAKSRVEVAAAATAGVMVQYPWAITRVSGV